MKNSELIIGYLNGSIVRGKSSSLSVRDDKLFSYDTVIAQKEGDVIYLNNTKYSSTTSTTQNALIRECESRDLTLVSVQQSIPKGLNRLFPEDARDVEGDIIYPGSLVKIRKHRTKDVYADELYLVYPYRPYKVNHAQLYIIVRGEILFLTDQQIDKDNILVYSHIDRYQGDKTIVKD